MVEPGSDTVSRTVLDGGDISRALTRITHEILERNRGSADVLLLGIPTRGVHLASRIAQRMAETQRNLYDGIGQDELALAPILAARTLVETEPNYAKVSARLLNDKLRRESLTFLAGRADQATQVEMAARYGDYFRAYVKAGIASELLDPELECE